MAPFFYLYLSGKQNAKLRITQIRNFSMICTRASRDFIVLQYFSFFCAISEPNMRLVQFRLRAEKHVRLKSSLFYLIF